MSRSGSLAYRKAKIVPYNLFAFPPSVAVIGKGRKQERKPGLQCGISVVYTIVREYPGVVQNFKKTFTAEAQRTQSYYLLTAPAAQLT